MGILVASISLLKGKMKQKTGGTIFPSKYVSSLDMF